MIDGRIALGRSGEAIASDALVRDGYSIVEKNYRCRLGELDIVAKDGDTLVFVEVRRRQSDRYGTALQTVNAAKQHQISRVAKHYLLARKPKFTGCRFDVVGITGTELVIIKDAFRLGDLATPRSRRRRAGKIF